MKSMKKWFILGYTLAVLLAVTVSASIIYNAELQAAQNEKATSVLNENEEESQIFVEADLSVETSVDSREPIEIDENDVEGHYHLAPFNDMVALFDDTGKVLEIYEIYLHILPPGDVEALSEGIVVKNDAHLRQLIEDFGG